MKFAVIGCGNIAQRNSIPAFLSAGLLDISVCVDIDPTKEAEISKKFSLPFEVSLLKAIHEYDFDAVYISTPNGTHKDIILTASQYGKHVICEKSVVTSFSDAKEVINSCKQHNVALFEGFMYQFHYQHRHVKELIQNGEIGTPFHFQAWNGFPPISSFDFRYCKSLGGGALLDAGAYTIHAARHFFGYEPEQVYALLEMQEYEVETRGTVLLTFKNNNTASLVFGFNNMYQNKYSIWGTKGVITLSRAFALPADFNSKLLLEKQGLTKEIIMPSCNHFVEEFNFFAINADDETYRAIWRNEILNQALTIQKIRDASI